LMSLRLFVFVLLLGQATFRGRGDVVELVASVRDQNRAVGGLAAADFRVTVNGVVQTVEVADNSVRPVDLTLAVSVDDNRIYQRADVAAAMGRIVAALRRDDRVRVILTDDAVRDTTGWLSGGASYRFGGFRAGPTGEVGDAVVLAMAHQPTPGRGHLILGISHWNAGGNIVDSVGLLEVARRSNAIAHLVRVGGWRSSATCYAGNLMMPRSEIDGSPDCEAMLENVRSAAEVTGGRFTQARGRDAIYSAFTEALKDFRDSYVLYFTPTGVSRTGQHKLSVTVPKFPRAQVRARSGY